MYEKHSPEEKKRFFKAIMGNTVGALQRKLVEYMHFFFDGKKQNVQTFPNLFSLCLLLTAVKHSISVVEHASWTLEHSFSTVEHVNSNCGTCLLSCGACHLNYGTCCKTYHLILN